MKCLETRVTPDGYKRRRYLLADGQRVTTYELPASVVRAVGLSKIRELLATVARGDAARASAQRVRAHVAANLDAKPTALAQELGVTEQRVRQVRKELRGE